jgi:hypothetical protein
MTLKRIDNRLSGFILVLALLAITASCDSGDKVRKYTAQSASSQQEAPTSSTVAPGIAAAAPGTNSHFNWETPEGWTQTPNSSSFRLTTFSIKSQDKEVTCTIIPLQGEAGGLEANVTRWLGQIASGASMAPNEATVQKILDTQEKFLTKGQFPAVMVDYTPITPKPTDISILAAVITVRGSSVFIKMMGEKALLVENKQKFKSLCQSFAFNANPSPAKEK